MKQDLGLGKPNTRNLFQIASPSQKCDSGFLPLGLGVGGWSLIAISKVVAVFNVITPYISLGLVCTL